MFSHVKIKFLARFFHHLTDVSNFSKEDGYNNVPSLLTERRFLNSLMIMGWSLTESWKGLFAEVNLHQTPLLTAIRELWSLKGLKNDTPSSQDPKIVKEKKF
uniref:Uncharacterized protein n=1 Tax=Populus davidiana TaxID=266767 RepID=A0A6M2ENS7_9ROSI